MLLLHLYRDADGESHFRELDLVPQDTTAGPTRQPVTSLTFSRRPGGAEGRWLPGAERHYVFFFAGQTEIGASDGTKKVFGAGDVLLIDDAGGKGHSSRVLAGPDRISAQVQAPA